MNKPKQDEKSENGRSMPEIALIQGSFWPGETDCLPGASAFSIFPCGEEVSWDFLDVATAFLKELLAPYHVLTRVWDFADYHPEAKPEERLPALYQRFSMAHRLPQPLFPSGGKELFTVTEGIHQPMTEFLVHEIKHGGNFCNYDVYAWKEPVVCHSWENGKQLMASRSACIHATWGKYPDYLCVWVKDALLKEISLRDVALRACELCGKRLVEE